MSEQPQQPKFNNLQEAIDFYLERLPKTQSTQDILHELRQCFIAAKATLTIDCDKNLAHAAAENAYITGQIAMLERLIAGGHIITG